MIQIKFYGLGGQGIVTAAKVLCEAAAIYENGFAQAIPAYGHERRGAPVYSDAMISRKPIKTKGFVYEPDYVVIFDDSVIEKGINVMDGVTEKTIFIVNTPKPKGFYPFKNHNLFWVDAQNIALNYLKRDIPNSAMLGALAGASIVGLDSVRKAIKNKFGSTAPVNINAAEAANEQIMHRSRETVLH